MFSHAILILILMKIHQNSAFLAFLALISTKFLILDENFNWNEWFNFNLVFNVLKNRLTKNLTIPKSNFTIFALKSIKLDEFSNRVPGRQSRLEQPNPIELSRKSFKFNVLNIKTLIRLKPCNKSYIKVFLRFLKLASFKPLVNRESVTFC